MSSSPSCKPVVIGVGLDTARYGHHATFLREDRQPAAEPLEFLECLAGYQELEKALSKLAQRHRKIEFHIRVDAAGQYAINLLAFLQRLPWPKTISVGEPRRNKRYREVHFPKRKADATESHACARFAIVERPRASAMVAPEFLALREVTSRLEFQVKQSTRLVNRLHNLLSRVFPELATLQNDLQARWVLRLLDKYPTAERIAKARLSSVTGIPNLSTAKGEQVHLAAGAIGCSGTWASHRGISSRIRTRAADVAGCRKTPGNAAHSGLSRAARRKGQTGRHHQGNR